MDVISSCENMEKVNLTLYTVIGDPFRIETEVRKRFQHVMNEFLTESGRVVVVLQDNTRITFTINHHREQPDFMASHTEGMANYFSQAEAQNEELQQSVLRQIRCFNCVVGVVFETDDRADRTNYIVNTLFDVAGDVNGFLLYPDMSIYNSRRQLVFSAEGESELTEFVPVGNADLLDVGRPEELAADKARFERSAALLQERGIPYISHLPVAVAESGVKLKSREEMLRRAAALFAVAVYSEVLLSENPDREEALFYVDKMEEIYGVKKWLSSAETAYLAEPEPEQNKCIQFVWRYECCGVLLWAAGIVEELPYPSDICDVPVIAGLFWQHKGLEDLLSKGIPRTDSEILDAADLALRYDWACVDARIHQREAPASLDGGVVMERHYAFDWLAGGAEDVAWDDVRPNT